MNSDDVTLSTKCWEGDYRVVLDAAVLADMFGPFGAAARRQVVLNRIEQRADAEARARSLVEAGHLDAFAWAEDGWPELAQRLRIPETWFGSGWPYAVPELTELDLATTSVVAHLAGDVRLEPGPPWLPSALSALADAAAVSPVSPSRIELVRPEARRAASGWVDNYDFSDQCFVVRRADLLRPEVVRAVHPANGRYPKPGGALTFEARVGSWLRATGNRRRIDVRRGYLHPVGGTEGDSYPGLTGPPEHLPPVVAAGPDYPPARSVPATAVVVARNAARTIGWTVASLAWAQRVVVVDQASIDGTAARASAAGAEVRPWPHPTVTGRAVLARFLPTGDDWAVILDADEMLTAGAAQALATAICDDSADVVEIRRATYVFGRRVRASAFGSDWAIRAAKASALITPTGLEAVRIPLSAREGARVRRLDDSDATAVVHFGSPDLHSWIAKMNDRTSLEARGTELPGRRTGRRTAKRFVLSYLRGGRREGRLGWRLTLLQALTTWLLTEKTWDLINGGGVTAQATYDEIASAVLRGERPTSSA